MANLINDQQPVTSSPAHASNEVVDITACILSLVRHAKLQGFLAHEDIERLVPACADNPEMAGQILDLLGQSGVSVTSTYDELDVSEDGEADDESFEREDSDLLAGYLKKVRRTQILTREEEFVFFARIDAAIAGGQESEALRLRNEVVQRNLRLVFSLARRYLDRGLPLGDLIQEGNIGLLKAVDKFELRRGYKLSTYAFYWIRQSMVRALCKHGRTISIPSHLFEKLNRIAAAQAELSEDLGRLPTVAELAEHTAMPAEELSAALKTAYQQTSLKSVLGEYADETDPECIRVLMKGPAGHDDYEQEFLPDLAQVLASLSKQEQEILSLRFGLRDGVELTLEDVGARFNVTRERIRQIEQKALRKLRHPTRIRQLQELSEAKPTQSGPGFDDFAKDAA
jgi:RNA polymerase primary sigma factor